MAAANCAIELDKSAAMFGNELLEQLLDVVCPPNENQGVYAKANVKANKIAVVPLTTIIAFKDLVPKDAVALGQTLEAPTGKRVTLPCWSRSCNFLKMKLVTLLEGRMRNVQWKGLSRTSGLSGRAPIRRR